MDLDDIFDDDVKDDLLYESDSFFRAEQLEMEMALISKKDARDHNAFSVNREYINSKAYRDKFDSLPVNREVVQSIYENCGRLLEAIDSHQGEGKSTERMIAINARTGNLITDNIERENAGNEYHNAFSDKEYREIQKCRDHIILIHNHSTNVAPSAQDLLTYSKEERIRLSVVACHDGTIYAIYGVARDFPEKYNMVLNRVRENAISEDQAKVTAITLLYRENEKHPGSRYKLFDVRKF